MPARDTVGVPQASFATARSPASSALRLRRLVVLHLSTPTNASLAGFFSSQLDTVPEEPPPSTETFFLSTIDGTFQANLTGQSFISVRAPHMHAPWRARCRFRPTGW